MATTIQKSYEVRAYNTNGIRAFALYDYTTREATVSIDYNGATVSRTLHAKEALEYVALTRAAALVNKVASRRFGVATTPNDARYGLDLMLEVMAAEVAVNVETHLYND